ncbi:MAG TPA: cytochrome P460 family protein [Rhizomicrobium sp.]|jgi:hypothetical protein
MRLSNAFGLGLMALSSFAVGPVSAQPAASDEVLHIDDAGKLAFPTNYREWVFLSSGLDMSYSADTPMAGQHLFNNVFAPRAAYEGFLKSGTWPDGTVLMLEVRAGKTNQSILKHGEIQTEEIVGTEAHVKDSRFKGGWAFFPFDSDHKPATEIPHDATCYSCHQAHAAADTTFVQFYPTLLPVATSLHTLSASYLAETAPKP